MNNFPNASFEVFHSEEKDLLSLEAFHNASKKGVDWSKTAVLSYKECYEDILSLTPLMYRLKMPLFYCSTQKSLNSEIAQVFVDNFDKVIIVGNDYEIQSSIVEELDSLKLEATRLVGKNTYHANQLINSFVEGKFSEHGKKRAILY